MFTWYCGSAWLEALPCRRQSPDRFPRRNGTLLVESCLMDGRVCQSVPEPIVELVDSQTETALSPDRVLYYRIGSSLELRCRVQRYWVKPLRFQWLKAGKPVSDDIWRGGIRSRTCTIIHSTCLLAVTASGRPDMAGDLSRMRQYVVFSFSLLPFDAVFTRKRPSPASWIAS